MKPEYIKIAVIIYIAVNIFVFLLYGADKRKAIRRKWRIPEATLITASFFGVFGALAGMYILRHKTKKPKFYITVPIILIAELAASAVIIYYCFLK